MLTVGDRFELELDLKRFWRCTEAHLDPLDAATCFRRSQLHHLGHAISCFIQMTRQIRKSHDLTTSHSYLITAGRRTGRDEKESGKTSQVHALGFHQHTRMGHTIFLPRVHAVISWTRSDGSPLCVIFYSAFLVLAMYAMAEYFSVFEHMCSLGCSMLNIRYYAVLSAEFVAASILSFFFL